MTPLLATLLLLATSAPAERPPHLVLVIIDTLRADVMSCYGYPQETCPELDALAAEAVLFERVVAPSSWTRPSVASLLTGLYPRTLGIYDEEGDSLPDHFQTLAELLRERGYRTVGLTANPNLNRSFNMHQGFDEYVESHAVFPWQADEEPARPLTRERRLRSARDLFRRADELLGGMPERPVYVQFNLMEVHEFLRGDLSLTRREFQQGFEDEPEGRRLYLRALAQVSRDVGDWVESLRRRPGFEDTYFLITSDHGQGLDSHPAVRDSKSHGALLYESNVRVPAILLHARGKLGPRRVAEPVRLLDFAPTLLALAGSPPPDGLVGRSLEPLLNGEDLPEPLPRFFVSETQFRRHDKVAAYGEHWKFFRNRDNQSGLPEQELQAAGPGENGGETSTFEQQVDVARRMRRYLRRWEERHPPRPAAKTAHELSEEERLQLEAIGYLGRESDSD